jgi:hypothetical protein
MKKLIISSIICLFCITVFSQQNNQSDTASPVYLHNVLRGTTILPGSEKNDESRHKGYWLDSLYFTSCSDVETEKRMESGDYSDKITLVNYLKDSLMSIEINIWKNCGKSFLCEIEIVDDTILNLIYTSYGQIFACECCFGIMYHIRLFPGLDEYKQLQCIMLNGKKETITKIIF